MDPEELPTTPRPEENQEDDGPRGTKDFEVDLGDYFGAFREYSQAAEDGPTVPQLTILTPNFRAEVFGVGMPSLSDKKVGWKDGTEIEAMDDGTKKLFAAMAEKFNLIGGRRRTRRHRVRKYRG